MPKINNASLVSASDLPGTVEIPTEYFPAGIGPGSFDPQLMYMHALFMNRTALTAVIGYEVKPWVILWLLDHVDWEKVKD